MGLQGHLNDVSSDSIPLFLLATLAKYVYHLRSFLFSLFHPFGLLRLAPSSAVDDGLIGSGLAGLIILAEQLNLNRLFSYRYCCNGDGARGGSICVVCLCTLKDGDQVRMLDCRHVFHKECFDGWLGHQKFNCPLCRNPLVADQSVVVTRRRVGGDLVGWFSLR